MNISFPRACCKISLENVTIDNGLSDRAFNLKRFIFILKTNVEFDDLECEGGTISGKVLKKEHIRRVLANYFDMEIVGVSQKLCPSSIKHAPYLKADVLSNVVFLDCGEDLDKFSLIELSGYTV